MSSFTVDDGFAAYSDRVAAAHNKCQRLGMALMDLKMRFFAGSRCSATASWTILIEIWQSDSALTFEQILQRGRDHQAHLDLEIRRRQLLRVPLLILVRVKKEAKVGAAKAARWWPWP